MAIAARLDHDGDFVSLELYPDRPKAGIIDFPDERDWPIDFSYDDEKLARGERELLGLEIPHIDVVTDEWLDALDALDLPRVDIPALHVTDARLSEVLRWARSAYGRRLDMIRQS